MFGTYCEVSIETLKQIKLKYIEDYEGLVQYLSDFHLLKHKPCLLAIDGLDHYVESGKASSTLTKSIRLHFLLSLITDCTQNHLDTSLVFKAHNSVVTYRCSAQDETDVLRLHHEFSHHPTSQIFYLCKADEINQPVTSRLFATNARPLNSEFTQIKYIEIFKLDPSPFYFEEEYKWKVGQKRDHSDIVKQEAGTVVTTTELPSKIGRPMPFKLTKL